MTELGGSMTEQELLEQMDEAIYQQWNLSKVGHRKWIKFS